MNATITSQQEVQQPAVTADTSTFLERALPLAARGIAVIPLLPRSKSAFLRDWEQLATTNADTIADWGKQYPDHNCGAVAVAELDGFWIFEVDSPNVITRIEKDTGKELPATMTVKSSPGRGHIYFAQSPASLAMGNLAQGFVIDGDWSARVDREYVVSPKSIHPKTGLPYQLQSDVPIVPAPDWLIAWLMSQKVIRKAALKPRNERNLISHGGIHDHLVRQAGIMRGQGHSVQAIENALVDWAHENCEPPLDDEKIAQVARSAAKWEQGNPLAGTLNIDGNLAGIRGVVGAPGEANLQLEPFITVEGDLFMKENIPPRKVLVRTINGGEPVFYGPSINQIFAWRGMGKTNLGFGLVAALSRGEKFLNWDAPEAVNVLYVEGELPAAQVQERWRQIIGPTNRRARLVTIDKQKHNMITSLSSPAGMERMERTLHELESTGFKIEVLFLDSISTLFNIAANDEETWVLIQSWLISLRSRGIAVFFFHHAGKSGMSRSHSKSEDMLDVSIKLEAPKDPEPGCLHAVMTYDKARSGLSEPPAEIKMHRAHSNKCGCKKTAGVMLGCPGDSVTWQYEPAINAKKQQALEMFSEGRTTRAVAKELKVPYGTCSTWRTQWSKDRQKPVTLDLADDLGPKIVH